MGGFAEELGLVGGDRVDQVDGLVLEAVLLEQIVAIGVNVVDLHGAHAAAQAPLQHGALVGRHLDAAVVLDERREALEIPGAELFVLGRLQGDGLSRHGLLRSRRQTARCLVF